MKEKLRSKRRLPRPEPEDLFAAEDYAEYLEELEDFDIEDEEEEEDG